MYIYISVNECVSGGLSTSAMLKVSVLDVNDNDPSFYPEEYNVSLRQGPLPDGAIMALIASDPDTGDGGKLEFRIEAGNGAGLFRIQKVGSVAVNDCGGLGTRTLVQTVRWVDGGV